MTGAGHTGTLIRRLAASGVRDSSLPYAGSLRADDLVAVVQDGENRLLSAGAIAEILAVAVRTLTVTDRCSLGLATSVGGVAVSLPWSGTVTAGSSVTVAAGGFSRDTFITGDTVVDIREIVPCSLTVIPDSPSATVLIDGRAASSALVGFGSEVAVDVSLGGCVPYSRTLRIYTDTVLHVHHVLDGLPLEEYLTVSRGSIACGKDAGTGRVFVFTNTLFSTEVAP